MGPWSNGGRPFSGPTLMRSGGTMLARLVGSAVLCAMAAVAAADDARFSGAWKINHELSQDLAAKIAAAAGSQSMSGGPGWARGTETWLPWGGGFSEPERVGVR